MVSVFTAPAPPVVDVSGSGSDAKVDIGINADTGSTADSENYTVIVEFPAYIESPVLNITYPAASTVDNETINQILKELLLLQNKEVYSHITNETINNYITESNITNNTNYSEISKEVNVDVTVINPPLDTPSNIPNNTASIDGFYFNSPVAVGTIGTGAGTSADPIPITVTVPYGTDLRNLAATVCYTGKEIAGIPGPNPLKDNARSFTTPVDYTVKANDGTTTKTYRVTITSALNNAKEITGFSFGGVTGTNTIISAMPNAAGKYPIVVTIPQGQGLSSLTPVITYTGTSIGGGGFNSDGGPGTVTASSLDFTSSSTTPVDYTVTAEDGSSRIYAVTVRNAVSSEDDIEITGFYFTEPLAVGAVNQNANTITVAVPSTTNTVSLRPTVYFKGMSVKPGSGAVNNFGGPVTYTVTGNSGKTRSYTVTVISTPSSTNDITRFTFPGTPNTETIIGAVPNPDGSYPISVWVPAGTALDNLAPPDITYTGVSVTPGGGTPGDPGNPPTYTVTAEDGSKKTYTVTVEPRSDEVKIITSLVFNEVPVTGGYLRVVASINQADHAVTAEVPFAADISALKPTITYIGRSIAGPGEGDKTANPFTDTARNFSSPQTYTVKDQSGAGQRYTVTVIQKSSVTVNFTGEVDSTVIAANVFDQNTGVITVTVNPANIATPYEWYVDGVKQPVPNTQNTFSLNVGDGTFTPGRQEIMVSGKKSGLHYTGKVFFTVSGGIK
jgi:hypothetical protein